MLRFYIGRAKTGKTKYIYDRISELEKTGEKSVLIVPPRFTFEAEKALSAHLGGGMLYSSVYSFDSFSRHVLEEVGESRVFLSRQGRFMLIRRALETVNNLEIFSSVSNKSGFVEELDKILVNFESCCIQPNDILSSLESIKESPTLRAKMLDLAKIYEFVNDYMRQNALDIAGAYNAVIEHIPNSAIARSHVFIDSVDMPTEQIYGIVEALMDTAKSVSIGIRADFCGNARDYELFESDISFYKRVKELAKNKAIDTEEIVFSTDKRSERYMHEELEHLEHELFAYPYAVYNKKASAIEIVTATDKASEVRMVAERILNAVYVSGLRFRDVAVIAANEDEYAALIRNEFKRAGIPMFSDMKRRLNSTPASRLIIAALKTVSGGYQAKDIITLIKTDLTGLTTDECEILENYMLEHGIYGTAMKLPFKRGNVPEQAEYARQKLIEPLIRLQENLAYGNVGAKTEAVYNYINELNIKDILLSNTNILQKSGRFELMEECAQVWNAIIETFTQLHTILGAVNLNNARFISVLEEGMNSYLVSVIPPSVDMVLFGSTAHTIPPNIKRLFVIGAVEGAFPLCHSDNGIINDDELVSLKNAGLAIWNDSEALTSYERLQIYSLLTLPSEGLCISSPMTIGGNPALQSSIIERLKNVFPKHSHVNDLDFPVQSPKPYRELDTLACALRQYVDTGRITDMELNLFARCLRMPQYADSIDFLKEALFYNASPGRLNRDFALKLYANGLYGSVTQFESFNSCPFSHFAKYGLRAKERNEFNERAVDMGVFCHEVLDIFIKHIIDNDLDYKAFNRDDCCEIIDALLPEALSNYKFGSLMETARGRARSEYYASIIKDTAYAVIWQMKRGEFNFLASEAKFGQGGLYPAYELTLKNGLTFYISGKVDRIDVRYDDELNLDLLRVIDYKLGGKSLDIAELYAGINMQLPLYMAAIEAFETAGKACGMYYMPVTMATASEKALKGDLENELMKTFTLAGLSIENLNVSPNIVSARTTKDGRDKKQIKDNCIVSDMQMTAIKRLAIKRATEAADGIISGNIDVSPYKYTTGLGGGETKSPCKYCPYISFCNFDSRFSSCKPRRINPVTLNEIFDDDTL